MAKQPKSALLDKLKKNSTLEHSSVLTESDIFNDEQHLLTEVPAINVALSGRLDRGMVPGLLQIAGESKHFKTSFLLLMLRSFQRKHPDGICLFYISEFGSPKEYFDAFGIDGDRVLICPVVNLEQLKFDLVAQLKDIEKGDPVMVCIDSLGNLASLKEVEDAEEGKSVADMSRAKAMKSFFRIITPHLSLKSIYMVVINHVYKEIGMFPKTIVGGGTGSYLASDNIWIIGREQEKDKENDVIGFNFNIKVEKSRFCREKSVLPIRVTFDGGIEKYSGLLEIAVEGGFIQRTRQKPIGYSFVNNTTGEVSNTVLGENDFKAKDWENLLSNKDFQKFVEERYKLVYSNLLPDYEPGVTNE